MEKGVPPHPFPCLFCGVSGLPGNQEPEVPPPRVPIACEDEIYGGRKGCSASLNIIGCVLDAAVLLPGFDASHALACRFCTPNRSHRFDSMFPCATCHLLKHIETDFSETGMFAMFAVILSYVVIVMKPEIVSRVSSRSFPEQSALHVAGCRVRRHACLSVSGTVA